MKAFSGTDTPTQAPSTLRKPSSHSHPRPRPSPWALGGTVAAVTWADDVPGMANQTASTARTMAQGRMADKTRNIYGSLSLSAGFESGGFN